MKPLAALSLIFLLTGCFANRGPESVSKIEQSTGEISADLKGAVTHIAAAVPHTDSVGQAHLTDATTDVNSAQTQVPVIRAANQTLSTTNAALAAQVKTFDESWLGGKGHRAIITVIIVCIIALIVGVALLVAGVMGTAGGAATPFIAGLMAIGHFILSLFPLIGHWISVVFSEIFRRQSVAVALAAPVLTTVSVVPAAKK